MRTGLTEPKKARASGRTRSKLAASGRRLFGAGLAYVCISACFSSISAADQAEYTATPIGMIATPTADRRYAKRLGRRQIIYDDAFRDPVRENWNTLVDCRNDRWIGTALLIERSSILYSRSRRPKIRHVWSHPEFDGSFYRLDHYHELRFSRRDPATIDMEWFDIEGRYRVDGTWTLHSFINGVLVNELQFTLVDCPSAESEAAIIAESTQEEQEVGEEEIVCRREKPIGSNIRQTVCRVRGDIDGRRERDQDYVRDIQNTPDGRTPR